MELIHSTEYMKYTLGDHHPTRPVRAENLLRLVHEAGLPHQPVEPTPAAREDLLLVHDLAYVEQVESGWNHEWDGHRPWLHDVASLIVGGTVGAARRIIAGETARAFHPMGAKHHAMRDRASGFCIYNDMAIAAIVLADAGMRVLYVDWDAHHGDGVEFLLEDRQDIMTASIHNGQIFPGTGQAHRPEANAFNWPLPYGSAGTAMLSALDEALEIGAAFQPDVILLAAGADGHREDPLGGLGYELSDFIEAARTLSTFTFDHCRGRLLAGGAGGYRAGDWTPAA